LLGEHLVLAAYDTPGSLLFSRVLCSI